MGGGERGACAECDRIFDDPFDAFHAGEAADVGDVGGLGRPRGNCAGTRRDDLDGSVDGRGGGAARAVGQEFLEDGALGGGQIGRELDDVDELGAYGAGGQGGGGEILEELGEAEGRKGR